MDSIDSQILWRGKKYQFYSAYIVSPRTRQVRPANQCFVSIMSNAVWRGEIDAGKTLGSGRILKTADESSERNIREAIDIHP